MDTAATAPTWRERVSGRWAISWQAQALGSVLVLVLIPLGGTAVGATQVAPSQTWAWFVATLVAVVAINAYVYLVHLTAFRHRRQHPIALPWLVLFHFGLGAIFGLVLGLMSQALGLVDSMTPLALAAGFGVGAILWCTSVSSLLASDEHYHRERLDLIDTAVGLELLSLSEARLATRLRASGNEAIDSLPLPTSTLLPLDEWWGISASLRDATDSRTLTDRLRSAAERRYPDVSIRTLLRGSLFDQGFASLAAGVIIAVIYLPDAGYRLGTFGPVASLVLGLVVAATLWLCTKATSAMPRIARLWFVLGLIVALAETLAFLHGYPGTKDPINPVPWTESLASILLVTMVVLITSGTRALAHDRDEMLTAFRTATDAHRQWQTDYLTTLSTIALDTAEQSMPPERTRLASAAAGIAAAAIASLDRDQAIDHMLELVDQVNSSLDAPDDSQSNLRTLLDRVSAPWEGLVDIDITMDPSLGDITGTTATLVSRVVEEAVANSGRHGHASNIQITLAPSSGGQPAVHLVVSDDGIGPQGGPAGLGSALFSEASTDGSVLSDGEHGGSVLTMDIRLDGASS